MKGLVSIITPCYNSASYVGRLLESVLAQDYPSVEMIAVDDASSDETAAVIDSYVERFEKRGYSLRCVRQQQHCGQSGAINNALKMVGGEYLVWPDSDDYYSSGSSLSKLVAALRDAPEDVGVSRCMPEYVDESLRPLKPGNGVPRLLNPDNDRLFHDAIWGKNGFWYLSGGYMVRMSHFDSCIEGREIPHAEHAGQSWQLLLPLFHRYRCVTVKEKLHTVVVRRDSHSRNFYRSHAQMMSKHRDFERVLLQTIENIHDMDEDERNRLTDEVRQHYRMVKFMTGMTCRLHLPHRMANKLMRLKDKYDSLRGKN